MLRKKVIALATVAALTIGSTITATAAGPQGVTGSMGGQFNSGPQQMGQSQQMQMSQPQMGQQNQQMQQMQQPQGAQMQQPQGGQMQQGMMQEAPQQQQVGQQMPPQGEMPQDVQMQQNFSQGQQPQASEQGMASDFDSDRPELPEDFDGERPELPEDFDGERPDFSEDFDGERPELPDDLDGERPELPDDFDGERPELPDGMNGDMPSMDSEAPTDMQGQGMPSMGGFGQQGQRPERGQFMLSEDDLSDIEPIEREELEQRSFEEWRMEDSQNMDGRAPMDGQQPGMDGERPELPEGMDGEMPSMDGERPELPDGMKGQTPEMNGEMPNGMNGQPDNMNGQPGGMPSDSGSSDVTAANYLTEDATGGSYTSYSDGENSVLANSGGSVSLSGATITKTGDSSSESADFYGNNASILATNGTELNLSDLTITTDGAHANGVFSYGTGTVVNISDSTITTSGNNSGGLMTTGGATLNANNLTVLTTGNSSAAIRSDRGGGTVNVTEGSYTAAGVGSPAVYSTADITIEDATLSATSSEAVVIEGGNSMTITDSYVSGNNSKLNGQSKVATNVLIYQSMSGDASEGESSFTMTGGALVAESGDMIHVTNTTTTINLTGVALTYANDTFLSLSADNWGTSGSNGGNATVNLTDQTVTGKITVDASSSLVLNIGSGSSYTGAISGNGAKSVTLSDDATWTLTGDTYLDSFSGDYSSIVTNGYHLYVGSKQVL